jgi:hypothetical protein
MAKLAYCCEEVGDACSWHQQHDERCMAPVLPLAAAAAGRQHGLQA